MADVSDEDEKKLGKRSACVKWVKIVSVGVEPCEELVDDFTFKELIYRRDYEIFRSVKDLRPESEFKNSFFDVSCKIHVSPLSKPMFECNIIQLNKSFMSSTPTTVSNRILSYFCHKKRWSGIEFFGFRRNDVCLAITSANETFKNVNLDNIAMEIDHADNNSNLHQNYPNVGKNKTSNVTWVGIKCLGENVDDVRFEYKVCAKKNNSIFSLDTYLSGMLV